MTANNLLIRKRDLCENPTTRVPVCLCLDTSGSMDAVRGEARPTGQTTVRDGRSWNVVTGGTTLLDELTAGVKLFYQSVLEDEIARASAEVCVVTFDDQARCVTDFSNIYRQDPAPAFRTGNNTAMGEGVNLALDLLERRKRELAGAGVDYYQPWLVLMTDGVPNGGAEAMERAVDRVSEAVAQRKLTVFPIAVGGGADQSALSRFAVGQEVLRLDGLQFRRFFVWLSQSVVRASQSMGQPITLDLRDAVGSWDSLND